MQKLLLSGLFFFSVFLSGAQVPDRSLLQQKAPDIFRAVFATTRGDFTIEVIRKWSPRGADRLYQLISSGFYNRALLFRVEPGFVVQFGISENYAANRFWDPRKLPDEPMQQKNTRGTLSFARGKKNDRSTQLFVNLANNTKLDTASRGGARGFTPVARVIKGIDVIERLNAEYGKQPLQLQDSLYKYGNFYFRERFPRLDKILSARILRGR